jgi:hypothetical protein
MFLLNRDLLLDYVGRQLIDIEPFDPESCGATYYYFRLAPMIKLITPAGESFIDLQSPQLKGKYNLPANGFAVVQSIEHFNPKLRVFATIGQPTDFALRGLHLVHGPTLDPTYRGPLKVAVRNLLNTPNLLELEAPIGKLSFFDVADTYPIKQPPKAAAAFEARATPLK